MNADDQVLAVYVSEYQASRVAVNEFLTASARFLTVGASLLGAAFVIGIQEEIYEVFLISPIALFILTSYWLNFYAEINSLGGYCKYIEECVNKRLGANVLHWEHVIAPVQHKSMMIFSLNLSFVMFLLSVLAVSLYFCYTKFGGWIFYASCGAWGVYALMTIISNIALTMRAGKVLRKLQDNGKVTPV